MHYSLRRPYKSPDSKRVTRSGRTSDPARAGISEQTVGAQLKAQYGAEYNVAWLSRQLHCSPSTAAELASYWLPQGVPRLRDQALNVFTAALGLDSQALVALLGSGIDKPRREFGRAAPSNLLAPPVSLPEPFGKEVTIGSDEGVRVVKQRQPTIVWRKVRKFVEQA